MPNKDQKIKNQRDQFLSFAFACADLFMEISEEGNILFVLGAAKGITGLEDHELIDKNWLELFSAYDQEQLTTLIENSKLGKRDGPLLVEMSQHPHRRKATLSSIKMPASTSFYITLAFSNKMMSKLAVAPPQENKDLANVSTFPAEAQDTFDFARSLGDDPALTLFDFGFTQTVENEFDPESWGNFKEELTEFLQTHSLNNSNPAEINPARYALTHDTDIDPEFLRSAISDIVKKHAPENFEFSLETQTIQADLSKIGNWEAEKALGYIITDFEACDDIKDIDIKTLSTSTKKYAVNNKTKIQELESIIERVDFSMHFQPAMHLKDNEPLYYEIIPHFREGSAQGWINLAEDTGLAPAFYLAFSERVVNHISFKAGGSRTKFSLSLPAQFIQQDAFTDKLYEHLQKGKSLGERLHIEISHPQQITTPQKINAFISQLEEQKIKVILDQCSLHKDTIELLKTLNISGIKIDKRHIRKINKDQRTTAALEHIASLCKGLYRPIEARGIETQDQASTLLTFGIECGQGPLFGEAQESPSFQPPQK